MKKFIVFLLVSILGVPLVLGAVVGASYFLIKADEVPAVILEADGRTVLPKSYVWHVPVTNGLLYRDFEYGSNSTEDFGILSESTLPIVFPEEYNSSVVLSKDGEQLWAGSDAEWNEYTTYSNGVYQVDVTCDSPFSMKSKPYGTFYFSISFTLDFEPVLETSNTTVSQGDVLAIRLSHLQEGVVPTIESTIPTSQFIPYAPGQMVAFVPTWFRTSDLEEYIITIQAGNYHWEIPMTVLWVDFPKQNMTIDTSNPDIQDAMSSEANAEYNNTIPPLYAVADMDKYWQGVFLQPVVDRISTEYGTRRYTNGALTSSFHNGMDIAADEGVEIKAAASGRVLFAGFLRATGNTVVIEHGGGIQTVYFHMLSISTAEGAMVERADSIGTVGSTGYSTGPHLHLEVRIAGVAINPGPVVGGTSNLYFFER